MADAKQSTETLIETVRTVLANSEKPVSAQDIGEIYIHLIRITDALITTTVALANPNLANPNSEERFSALKELQALNGKNIESLGTSLSEFLKKYHNLSKT